MELDKHLIDLSNRHGIAGDEAPIRQLIAETWEPLVDVLRVDPMGSLVATIQGTMESPRPRILITAHMDEIGLMVTRIKDGFIGITNVGGIDKRVLPGQPVIVHGEKPLPGLIGTRPPHVVSASERKHYPSLDELVVDTGLSQKQLEKLVRVGDRVSFDIEAIELGDGLITGKAMDNRASVACMTRLLEHLSVRRPQWDVVIAATVQEETGLKGGETLAWAIEPDLAIVVDVGFGIGVGVGDDKGFKLGDGPTLMISPDTHLKLFHMVREVAKEQEYKITTEVEPGASGTEAHVVHISRSGVPTAVISIPIRNMHTPAETVAVKDIKRAARLIAAFIWALDGKTLDKVWLDDDGEET